MSLEQLCRECNNFFELRDECIRGPFTVEGGCLELPGVADGQYVRVKGSVFSDGVHRYPIEGLTDETFGGCVWPMAVPAAFMALSEEVDAWKQAHQGGEYQSESFGGYSYTRATGENGPWSWRDEFRGELDKWRKL